MCVCMPCVYVCECAHIDRLWNIDMFWANLKSEKWKQSFFLLFFGWIFGSVIVAVFFLWSSSCLFYLDSTLSSAWSQCGYGCSEAILNSIVMGPQQHKVHSSHTHTHTLKHIKSSDTHCYILRKYITPNREFEWMWKSCSVRLTLILNHIIKIFFPYFMVHADFILSLSFVHIQAHSEIWQRWCITAAASVGDYTRKYTHWLGDIVQAQQPPHFWRPKSHYLSLNTVAL